MTTVAELCLPADETGLAVAFDLVPSLTVEMEHAIARNVPGLWLSGADRAEIESALDADPSVDEATLVVSREDEWLYDLTFRPGATDAYDLVVEEGGTLLDVTGVDRQWYLRIRMTDRDRLSSVYDRLCDRGVRVEVIRLSDLHEGASDRVDLTPEQRESLAAAFEHGYFEIPRQVSMQELAAELGISHQALSERLRRAYETLVGAEIHRGEATRIEADGGT